MSEQEPEGDIVSDMGHDDAHVGAYDQHGTAHGSQEEEYRLILLCFWDGEKTHEDSHAQGGHWQEVVNGQYFSTEDHEGSTCEQAQIFDSCW